ncbi:hypothetical protein [Aquibacillus kalidii]|uniref:hypothetical protein n=1 Tax=Aquibacillus kalidii TaxID=2762597 RepID=UPI00164952C4|nr:hypothetical protein [Aquibacillus kalidii]
MVKRKKVLFIFIGLLILMGCQPGSSHDQGNNELVSYEYLPLDKTYSKTINDWLTKAKNSSGQDFHSLSLDNGEEYVYGKGYNMAKVSFTSENFEGKIESNLKATMFKGESKEEVLIKITYNTEFCCDGVTIDVTDEESN